jgi:hypothetical protein
MNKKLEWKEFKAKMVESGVCTNSAARQILVQEYVRQERKGKEEEATITDMCEERESIPKLVEVVQDGMFAKMQQSISLAAENLFEDEVLSLNSSMSSLSNRRQSFQDLPNLSIRSTSFVASQMLTRQISSKKRSSFSFSQLYGGLTKEEEDQKLYKSERQEKFGSMVRGYVGEQTLEKPTPPIQGHVKSRSSFSLRFSVTESSVGSTDALRTSFSQQRTSTYGLHDIQALSSYLATFVDDSDEDEEGDENDVCDTVVCNALAEVKTDGKVKRFSVNEEEVVMDAPSLSPHVVSAPSTSILQASEYDSDKTDEGENLASTAVTNRDSRRSSAVFNLGSTLRARMWTSLGSEVTNARQASDNEEEFVKPAKWVEWTDHEEDDSDDDNNFTVVM